MVPVARLPAVTYRWILSLAALVLAGCGGPKIGELDAGATILAFGDSLTYGYNMSREASYPAQLESRLGIRVINAGVSGETTEEGLLRLPEALEEHSPDLVLLCLGGNDMLRRYPRESTEANLRRMVELIQETGADVILIGVPKPGILLGVPDYFGAIAEDYGLPYEGGIMRKVLANASLKVDHIHPNEQGYAQIAGALQERIERAAR